MSIGATGTVTLHDILPRANSGFAFGRISPKFNAPWIRNLQSEVHETGQITLANTPSGVELEVATAAFTTNLSEAPTQSGTAGNDKINVISVFPYAVIDISQGGNDIVVGSSLDDVILVGAALTAADKIDGKDGFDRVVLNGDYSVSLTLGKTTLTNIATIVLSSGNSYKLTTNDATVAAGASLTIDASALSQINSATINASSEKNATIVFLGGAGADVFTGGAGADFFVGGFGPDTLSGGKGADNFQYRQASDSPLLSFENAIDVRGDDTIVGFETKSDIIDLTAFGFLGAAQSIITKSSNGFARDLSNGSSFFGTSGVAVEYAGSGKLTSARVYVDANHDGNLGAGDLLLQITGTGNSIISATNFKF